jgi:3-deoxy-D-manno-octulosonic-acid transferase
MHIAFDLLYLTGILLASPWLTYRYVVLRQSGAVRRGELPDATPRGGVWLHGSSVGEVTLVRELVALLERQRPELPVVISSHTATGVEAARRAYPRCAVFRLPLDLSFVQRRLMRRLDPVLVVIVESDLWPNQLLAARRQGVPVAIVNAKLSERSFRLHRWTRIVPLALRKVALVAAQTEVHADRFAGLGLPPQSIQVTGNMKYDLTADDASPSRRTELRSRLGIAAGEVVIIGGSLHAPEDEDLLAAYAATRGGTTPTRLIIVPRYPDQAPAVIANAKAAGFAAAALSELERDLRAVGDPGLVIIVDKLGELRRLYAAADIAFVGGSLYYRGANKGGHNLMEPAILGLPVIFGPHNFSFRETVVDLRAAKAGIEVRDRTALTAALTELASSASRRAEIGARARQVVLENQGASLRNLELLLALIGDSASCRANPEDAQCRHQTLKSLSE